MGSEPGIKHQLGRQSTISSSPKLYKGHHVIDLLPFQHIGMRVTDHLAIGILGSKGHNGRLTATALAQVMGLNKLILAKKGDGMETQIETFASQQPLLA